MVLCGGTLVAFTAYICSVYQAFGLVVFCPFRVFAAFRGHWGWTLTAFTALVVLFFIGHWDWTLVAFFSVCSVYEGCRLVFLSYLFIFLCGVAGRCV